MAKQLYTVEKHGTILFSSTDFCVAHAYAGDSGNLCYVPTKFEIELLKAQGMTRQQAAESAMGSAGVFNIAFFGHGGSRHHKARVRRIWKKINEVFNQ